MPTPKKEQLVKELQAQFARATITISTGYAGLTIPVMNDVRQKLREKGVEYRVVKNTLAHIAADNAKVPAIKATVQGPTAIALGYGDPVDAAKAIDEVVRVARINIKVLGGTLNGKPLAADQITALAALPPKPQLVAKLLGQMNAPITSLVATLNAPIAALAIVLGQRVKQMEAEPKAS